MRELKRHGIGLPAFPPKVVAVVGFDPTTSGV
jgi:hypothetical protein